MTDIAGAVPPGSQNDVRTRRLGHRVCLLRRRLLAAEEIEEIHTLYLLCSTKLFSTFAYDRRADASIMDPRAELSSNLMKITLLGPPQPSTLARGRAESPERRSIREILHRGNVLASETEMGWH